MRDHSLIQRVQLMLLLQKQDQLIDGFRQFFRIDSGMNHFGIFTDNVHPLRSVSCFFGRPI